MTVQPKRKISVSLDADLVEALESVDEALSKQVNDALRQAVEDQRRRRALVELLDELTAVHGPVDERAAARYDALLGQ
ncbi:MAG: type II toxin-antitoxin system CcdA family antitoxin [Kineosporiaceae bacterium]